MNLKNRNVILLTIDCLRKDVLGSYGNDLGLTPFLDSLQNKCIKFNHCQAAGPYTQASFPGLLSSSYYLEFGKEKQLSTNRILISEVLQKAGYQTAGFHSNPYLSGFFGWNRGWDEFYDSMQDEVSDMVPYILGDKLNSKSADWLTRYLNQKNGKPFFLWIHYMDVHEPYVPEREYIDMIDSSIKITKEEMFSLFKDILLPRKVSDPDTVEIMRKLYYAHVRQVDDYVKEFFDILEEFMILENSMVIITSDHGDEFNEHGGLSHDGKMYSELVTVPLMIYNPTMAAAKVCDEIVSGVDIPPTIAYIFNVEIPEEYHGQSLLPLNDYHSTGCFASSMGKSGHKVKDTDRPIYMYQENNIRVSYRVEDDRWELYDLREDPKELNNLIQSPMAKEYKEKLNINLKKIIPEVL